MRRLLIPRRDLIIGAAASICAPAIIRAQVPMTGAGKGAPSSAAWTPASISSGLIGWYDASASNVLYKDVGGTTPATTTGDLIKLWKDISGNNNHISQNSSILGPLLNTAAFNSKKGVVFATGNTDGLFNTSFPIGTGSTSSFWAVAYITASSPSFARVATYSAPSEKTWLLNNSGVTQVEGFDNSSILSGTNFTSGSANPFEYGGYWDGVNFNLVLNNGAPTQTASTFSYTNAATLGIGNNQGASPFDGAFAEFFITNSNPPFGTTLQDRTNVHNYFSAKWGV